MTTLGREGEDNILALEESETAHELTDLVKYIRSKIKQINPTRG